MPMLQSATYFHIPCFINYIIVHTKNTTKNVFEFELVGSLLTFETVV